MNVNTEYHNICDSLIDIVVSDQTMYWIKNRFRDDINSDRVFSKIKNIRLLVKILEKRDCLNKDNVSALNVIAILLDARHIIERIDRYIHNQHEPEILHHRVQNVLPPVPTDPEERVYDLISSEIGQKWKDLARNLHIKEGFIDNLELLYHYKQVSQIVKEMLSYHKANCDNRYWRAELCKALDRSRRKDLSEKVQRIFATYNLM